MGRTKIAAALAAVVLGVAPAQAADLDAPPVGSGLILFGSILPAVTLVPVMDGEGDPSTFPPGPDTVWGFDRRGRRLFEQTFRDGIYNYYVFVPLAPAKRAALHRLRLKIRGHLIEQVASEHGPPVAHAHAAGTERVRITWNDRAFPRLACHDEAGGSPAPLMLDGDFTAADIRGDQLACDFSDGVKTVFRNVRVPIETERSLWRNGDRPLLAKP